MGEYDSIELPTFNAALVRAVKPSGELGPKASGTLLAINDELYLLTNWHVATGRRWQSPEERVAWKASHGDEIAWMSKNDCYSPRALRVSIWALGEQRILTQIDIEDESSDPGTYGDIRYAWDSPDEMFGREMDMPNEDVVCLHLGRGVKALGNRISIALKRSMRVGYGYEDSGVRHGLSVSHQVFVVGYPRGMGRRHTDPPVWTNGTVATDPFLGYDGNRYLIDARTRSGQSGSAVIAFAPASGGLGSQHQLLGLYSGRIDEASDIGFAWRIEDIVEGLATRQRVPREVVPSSEVDFEPLLPYAPRSPAPAPLSWDWLDEGPDNDKH